MPVSEFGLIKQFFTRPAQNRCTRLSVGDDCALLSVPEGYELAITTDTMVENVHFFPDVNPEQLAYKLLAVNLSDLASMGAEPIAVTLALTLPRVDDAWLLAFSKGLFALAGQYGVDLVGGDTTLGSLTLSIQAMGLVKKGKALKRSGAKAGDLICVTGSLGDAALGLKIKQGYNSDYASDALHRFNMPSPKVEQGLLLQGVANACIDISDGLAADLGHILESSQLGALLNYSDLPLSKGVKDYIKKQDEPFFPLSAGEDYQLCFTISPEKMMRLSMEYTCIGVIEQQQGLRLKHQSGEILDFKTQGYDHFKKEASK